MFLLLIVICLSVIVAATVLRGSQTALAVAVALMLLLPSWMYRDLGGARLDIRQAIGLLALAAVLLDPRVRLSGRIVMADLLVLALAGANVASEMLNDVVTLTMIVNILATWLISYFVGRCLVLDAAGLRRAVPLVAIAVSLLAVLAVLESITRVNVTHLITGHGGSLQAETDIRWGLRRAEGSLTHPIFFGLLVVMTLPWTIEAARLAKAKLVPVAWRWLPWLTSAGAFFTMSRGPQLSVLGTFGVMVWFRNRTLRPFLTGGVVMLLTLGIFGRDQVLHLLHAWSGEHEHLSIEIHGELHEYSGTTHRLLQVLVFGDALDHAGWFGYGSTPLMAGHNKLPYVEEHLRQRFSSIDNHYLEYTLRCGYLGIGLFITLSLVVLGYLARAAWQMSNETRVFAAALLGAQLLVTINLVAVWFATDFSFVWLLNAGLAASLHSDALGSRRSLTRLAPSVAFPRSLSPGHPNWAPNT